MKTRNDIIQEWTSVISDIIQDVKEYDFKEAFKKALKHLNSGTVFQYLTKIQSG